MNTKAAMELSITTIVILILAITVLGLGLMFITGVFSKTTDEFEKATDIVDKQFIDQLKTTNKVVDIDRTAVDLLRSESAQLFIAFNNKEEVAKTFSIDASCTRLGDVQACTDVTMEYKTSDTDVQPGDVVAQPVNIEVGANAKTGTYVWAITVTAGSASESLEIVVNVG